MSRIINPESAGKERNQLQRAAVLALRELMQQSTPNDTTRDLAAFLVIVLEEISQTIEPTVAAWEKRGYWIKADRFRLEWEWCERLAGRLRKALIADQWIEVAQLAAQVGSKLNGVKLPLRHRLGTPWVGAWERLNGSLRPTISPASRGMDR